MGLQILTVGSESTGLPAAHLEAPYIKRPEKIHALTSLRFFAAFLVVLYHTAYLVWPSFGSDHVVGHFGVAGRVLSLGFISVSFFFLLSGYILAMVYLNGQTKMPQRKFYQARFARVYPLFLLMLVVDTPFLLMSRIAKYGTAAAVLKTVVTFISESLMFHAWIPKLGGIDFPNWSLSVEAIFYLIFPFVGFALWRLRGVGLFVSALIIYGLGQTLVQIASARLSEEVFRVQPLLHVSTFLLGILLARWQTLRQEQQGESPRPGGLGTVLALLLAASGFACVIHWLPWLPINTFNHGLLAPFFACVIWAFSGSRGWPAKLLGMGWLTVLGEASYGLYLLHIPVLHVYFWLGGERMPLLYPIYLGTCVALSVLSFYMFEVPARRWVLARLDVRPRETVESSSAAQ